MHPEVVGPLFCTASLQGQLDEKDAEIAKLRVALEEIAQPIAFIRKNLKEGEALNGSMAIALANDPNYLKGIAKAALRDVFKEEE
jgi:hypothetical protein